VTRGPERVPLSRADAALDSLGDPPAERLGDSDPLEECPWLTVVGDVLRRLSLPGTA